MHNGFKYTDHACLTVRGRKENTDGTDSGAKGRQPERRSAQGCMVVHGGEGGARKPRPRFSTSDTCRATNYHERIINDRGKPRAIFANDMFFNFADLFSG